MLTINASKPLLIAGPCSAESQSQIMAVAHSLSQLGISYMRVGVWKPRTRPGAFEGMGAKALEWLQEASLAYGLPYITEVAEPAHVEAALRYGAGALWVGARTTVNPFQVQHIADALAGIDIPIFVKNPVNPDIELWQGAIERFAKAGITRLAAIHRGFTGYKTPSGYRNQPNWPIPMELKRRMPALPLLCDPSHITGNASLIADVAQKALDLHFDGLMIETHPSPATALTDAAQQITPQQLQTLLEGLQVKAETTPNAVRQTQLEYLRQQVDAIDAEIIDLLARRMEIGMQAGEIKYECGLTAYQPTRWREIVEETGKRADLHGLNRDFITKLYEKIHLEGIRLQLALWRTNADSKAEAQ